MSLFKKRPKRFFGTQHWKLASPTPTSGATASVPIERPTPIETSCGKKFAIVRLKSLDYSPPPPPAHLQLVSLTLSSSLDTI